MIRGMNMRENLMKYWRILGKYLRPQWLQVILLGILFFVGIGLQLTIPQIIRIFIDSAGAGEAISRLINIAVIFIGIALIQQIVSLGITYISQNIGWKSTNALREDLAIHCLKLDMTFHKKNRPGELIERVDGDVTAMFNFFSNLLVEVLSHITLIIGVLVLLYLENIYIGFTMTIFIIIAMFIMGRIHSFAVPHHIAVRKKVTNFYGFLGEALGSTEDIRSNGAVDKIIWKLKKIQKEWLPLQLKASLASMSMWTSTLLIFAIGNALVFGIGGVLWSKGIITVGTVYMIFHYTEMLSMPLREIQHQLTDLQKAGASVDRVEELLKIKSNIADLDGTTISDGPLSLEIDKLTFEYEEGLLTLDDISFELQPGKVLGILGRTGSGKTTLARLITRFYDASKGKIKINDDLINNISLRNLRNKVAFVTQDVQLFNASIRDNLTFFNNEINDEKIYEALKYMGLDEWFGNLPNGLDTIIKSDGGGLSGGEAQLIAFVRVFLKNPGLIILDEASSRLDPLTERLMEGAIDKLFENRTAIIIAHRFQTVERAHEIIILEKGKIVEHGNRLELSQNDKSYFFKLLQEGIKEVLA